jgi:hypothetical protein
MIADKRMDQSTEGLRRVLGDATGLLDAHERTDSDSWHALGERLQPTFDPREDRHIEREILYALTDPDDNQPLWSVDDLAREIGERPRIEDAIASLQSAGLIYRTSDGFVFATRAAVRQIQIIGRVD